MDFKSMGRALLVCGAAFLLVFGLAIVIAIFYGPAPWPITA